MPVCIAGMHRSGTSLVAQLLNSCGLELGPEEDLYPASPDNQDGYWEKKQFVELNDDLLLALGGGWDQPPEWPTDWRDAPRFQEFLARAKSLTREFDGREPWGWKDPRNSLLLPFWQELFPDLKVVICLRNPLDVASSLRKRSWASYPFGLNLWRDYNRRLLTDTRPEQRIVTNYDVYFTDSDAELNRVAQFLELPADAEQIAQAAANVKSQLRHQQFTLRHLEEAGVAADIIALYRQLLVEAGGTLADAREPVAALIAGKKSKVVSDAKRGSRTARAQNGSVRSATADGAALNLAAITAELATHELQLNRQYLAQGQQSIQQLQSQLEVQRQQRETLEREFERAQQQLLEVRHELELARHEQERLAQHAAARQTDLTETQQRLEAAQSRLTLEQRERFALHRAVAKQHEALEDMRALLREVSADRNRMTDALAELRRELRDRQDEYQAALLDLQDDIKLLSTPGTDASAKREYRQLVRALRGLVRDAVPPGKIVAVVSKGDDDLLAFAGRAGWHFPRNKDGVWAGYYPANGRAAIVQVETLRACGADYLAFPHTALWWFDTYPELKQHLEQRYSLLAQKEKVGRIFALAERAAGAELDSAVQECAARAGRDPAILDLGTGWDLAARFPACAVFSPPVEADALPYCDRSVDLVAVLAGDERKLAEARRVAGVAVVVLPPWTAAATTPSANKGTAAITVEWQAATATDTCPATSIIIPVHNQWSATAACLRSLWETLPSSFQGEVLIADDASSDETAARLAEWSAREPRLKVIRNAQNEGFLRTCNKAVQASSGEVVVLLNNDTVLLDGWLPPLWRVLREFPDAGAVGGKLLFADGSLQEAGGMVFRDGSAANFGRSDANPQDLLYNFVRPADYCSGALLAFPRRIWDDIGGFDTRYAPAYYEDTDFCFAVRALGKRVYYQPACEIVHLEGLSSGTDTTRGVKRYQMLNQEKFLAKWADVLPEQPVRPEHHDTAACRGLALAADRGACR